MGIINEDLFVGGNFSCRTLTCPSGNITDDAIKSAAKIQASKLQGEFNLSIDMTGTIVAATRYLRIIRGTTALALALQAAITETIATGADRTVTLDLKRSTGAAAFSSILTATLVFNNADTLRTAKAATILSPNLIVGDLLQLTVAVAGAAGAQAAGLLATLTLNEDAN